MNTSANLSKEVKENKVPGYFSREEIIPGSVICLVLILVAATGNMMTCFIIYRKPGLRTPTNISILLLSVSDILMAFPLASLIKGQWIFSHGLCTFSAWFIFVLLGASFMTMACTAIFRYFCGVKPSLHQKYERRTFCIYTLDKYASVWNYSDSALIVTFSSVIFLAYFKVFRFVSHHNHAVAGNLQQENNSHFEEAKITKTVAIVVLGFVSCCAPATAIHFVVVFGGKNRKGSSMPAYAFLIQTLCICLTRCINPFIYGFTNRRFRKEYLELLRSFNCP